MAYYASETKGDIPFLSSFFDGYGAVGANLLTDAAGLALFWISNHCGCAIDTQIL